MPVFATVDVQGYANFSCVREPVVVLEAPPLIGNPIYQKEESKWTGGLALPAT